MIPRPIRAAFKKSWLKGLVAIVILVVGELLKDRIANWANLAIDSESGAVLEYIAPIIKEMAIAPLGYTVAAAVIVIIVIFVHAYLKEYSLKKKTSDIADTQEYMPLPEAARLVYEGLRKVDKGHPQVIMAESGPSVLDFFAIAISLETDVYGEHPPSTMLELLDSDELNKYGQFDDHGNTFKYYGEEEAKYIHLAIKKASLNKIIETLLAERTSHIVKL